MITKRNKIPHLDNLHNITSVEYSTIPDIKLSFRFNHIYLKYSVVYYYIMEKKWSSLMYYINATTSLYIVYIIIDKNVDILF